MSLTKQQIFAITEACREFRVKELYAFGSIVRGDFGADSDADFLVEFIRSSYEGSFDQYFGFKGKLEAIMNRKVDLVCRNAIRNPVFKKEVESTKEMLYAA